MLAGPCGWLRCESGGKRYANQPAGNRPGTARGGTRYRIRSLDWQGNAQLAYENSRRVVSAVPGNPYAFSNIICDDHATAANGQEVCVDGTQNMSSVIEPRIVCPPGTIKDPVTGLQETAVPHSSTASPRTRARGEPISSQSATSTNDWKADDG